MPSYHYIALNQDHQELSGVIEAPDEARARQKLNVLSLSVVSLSPLAANAAQSDFADAPNATAADGKTVFEFEALDKNGKKIAGTITSESAVKAYARLFDEYKLNVTAMFSAQLAADEKEQARKLGIDSLRKQYEKNYGGKTKQTEQENLLEAQQVEQKELLSKVDFTIARIETFLKDFSGELKAEERDIIQSYINQLMRIKDSTNLEHIRTTCSRMLDHIQKQELFLHEEQRRKESAQLKVDTRELLDDLKHTGLKKDIDIEKIAAGFQNNPVLKIFASAILKLFTEQNPEIRELKNQIAAVNGHIWAYVRIFVAGKSKIMRMEALDSIKTLFAEKSRLKLKIKTLKMAQKTPARDGRLIENIAEIAGFALAFYLMSYIVSYPFTIKRFNLHVPHNFYFYATTLTKGVTIFLFVAYVLLTARNFWLKNRPFAAYAFYFVGLAGFLLIAINLM